MTLSGLDSVVTSASGTSPNASRTASTTETRSRGGSSVGVPPPKNTVDTGGAPSPSTARACRISATACAAYDAREAPPPSSSAV